MACQEEVTRRREIVQDCTDKLQKWSKTKKAEEERVANLEEEMIVLQEDNEKLKVRLKKAREKAEQASAAYGERERGREREKERERERDREIDRERVAWLC